MQICKFSMSIRAEKNYLNVCCLCFQSVRAATAAAAGAAAVKGIHSPAHKRLPKITPCDNSSIISAGGPEVRGMVGSTVP